MNVQIHAHKCIYEYMNRVIWYNFDDKHRKIIQLIDLFQQTLGEILASGGHDHSIVIWKLSTGTKLQVSLN